MSEDGRALVRELLRQYAPHFPLRHSGRLVEDTSEFMEIGYGDVMALAGKHYLVIRDEAERRFGMEDPKFWVKRCTELETGERKIIKLVFYETFPLKIGTFEIHCHRSPDKEARILNLVRDDLRFMQGETVRDSKNNNVRILDVVHGKRLDTVVEDIGQAAIHCGFGDQVCHVSKYKKTGPRPVDLSRWSLGPKTAAPLLIRDIGGIR